jgi:4-amino-4-deoxy-L-arabinose transferase-like glycosyltransferase
LDPTIKPRASTLIPRAGLALLLLILVFAAAVRVYTFHGFGGIDDAEYARFAALLADGREFPRDYAGPGVFPLRLGVVAPTAVVFRLFGVNEWTMVLYPLVLSLASIVLIYICASLFFEWRGGLIAAALLAAYYTDIDSATRLLPDLPGAFFALLGVTIVLARYRRPAPPSRMWWWGIAAGLAFGASWLCKEAVAYMAPFCLVLMYLTIKRDGKPMWLLWGGVAAASLSILVVEALAYAASTGDLLFRLHEVERNYRQWENGFFVEGSNYGWAPGTSHSAAIARRLFITGPARILFDPALYYLPCLGLVAAAYGWWQRDRAFLIPSLWLCTLVLIFNFGSSSLSSYIPLVLYYRYLYPIYFPAIVLVSGLLVRTLLADGHLHLGRGRLTQQAVGAATLLAIASAAGPQLYYSIVQPAPWAVEVRALRGMATPDTVVYADALTLRAFEFFNAYPARTAWTDFDHLGAVGQIQPGSLVIVNDRYIQWLNQNAGMWVAWPPGPTNRAGYKRHDFYTQAPEGWSVIWKNGNARVYRTGGSGASPSPVR